MSKESLQRLRRRAACRKARTERPIDWFCPSQEINVAAIERPMLEIVSRYEVDGVQYDFIRYPNLQGCFCPQCRGCIGKWHLGFRPGMRPMDQGFDSYYGVLHNLDRFETAHFENEGGMPILRGDAVVQRPADPAKLTGLYTQEAIRFIDAHRSSKHRRWQSSRATPRPPD